MITLRKKRVFKVFITLVKTSCLFLFVSLDYKILQNSFAKENSHSIHLSPLKKIQSTNNDVAQPRSLKEERANHSRLKLSKNRHYNVDVLIIGHARSGTTFLGELFNQHRRIAYIYEPLVTVIELLQNNVLYEKEVQEYREKMTTTLGNFLTCNFTGNEGYLRKFVLHPFSYKSKFLQLKPTEKMLGNFSEVKKFYEKELCSFEHRAMKLLTGRLSNLSIFSLEETIRNAKKKNREVKIVHIVRDPRAVVYSWTDWKWIKDYPNTSFYQIVRRICGSLNKNLQLRKQRPKWMENHYKFIRYEDLVLAPKKLVKEIYDYLGIQLDERVFRWIDSRLKGPSQDDLKNAHSTKRNASITINRWKKNMTKKKRKAIERACLSALEQLNL